MNSLHAMARARIVTPVSSELAADTSSSQTELVEDAVAWLSARVRAATESTTDLESWQPILAATARELSAAQPAMAVFLTLGTRILQVAEAAARDGAPLAEAEGRVLDALNAWHDDWRSASDAVVRQAAACWPATGWVATYSHSSLVERALLDARTAGRTIRVLLAEGRPALEGHRLARTLARADIPVWLATDASLPLLLPQAGALVVGADAVRERTLVNKAGTFALLLVARELNLPAFALAQRAKFLPDRCRRLLLPQRDAAEVWSDAPPGVHVVNLAFEETPLALFRGIVTENGMVGPQEAGALAADSTVAEALCEPEAPRDAGEVPKP